jgi:hypothetical protein
VEQGDGEAVVLANLMKLVNAANAWNGKIILPNYERECETIRPDTVARLLKQTGWDKDTGWSTLAWLQNDVDFTPIAHDPVLLQIFPADTHWPLDYGIIKQKMGDCVWHARQKGFTYVGVTYQTYAGATPALFDVESYQHSVFPGNVIGHGEWPDWFQ